MIQLTDEEKKLLEEARVCRELVDTSGWKMVVDTLARFADAPLAAMRASQSSDPQFYVHSALRWRERENMLDALQGEIMGKIEDGNRLLREIALAEGRDSTEAEQVSTWEGQDGPFNGTIGPLGGR